jgi:hypothetical protein
MRWDDREIESGWCSHCVTMSEHTREQITWLPGLWRSAYKCNACGEYRLQPRALLAEPRCTLLADVLGICCCAGARAGKRTLPCVNDCGAAAKGDWHWDDHYCLLCEGTIVSWPSSGTSLWPSSSAPRAGVRYPSRPGRATCGAVQGCVCVCDRVCYCVCVCDRAQGNASGHE